MIAPLMCTQLTVINGLGYCTGCLIQLTVQLTILVCTILGYGMMGRTCSLGAQPWANPGWGVISIINICRHMLVCWFPCPPCWVAGNRLVNAHVNAVIPQLFLLRSVSATDQ